MATTKEERIAKALEMLNKGNTSANLSKEFDITDNKKSTFNPKDIDLKGYDSKDKASTTRFNPKDIDLEGYDSTDSSSVDNKLDSFGQLGNTVGAVSGAVGNLVNLGITLASKEKTQVNPFANYAHDTLAKLSEMSSGIGAMKDMQLADLALSKNTARQNNRESARGINEMRALDMGTFIAGLGETRKIEQNAQEKLLGIQGKQADVLMNRDLIVMQAQERTNDINQLNKDAYLSGLSSNVMDISNWGQKMGGQLNQTEADGIAMKLIGQGKYGDFSEYMSSFGFNK